MSSLFRFYFIFWYLLPWFLMVYTFSENWAVAVRVLLLLLTSNHSIIRLIAFNYKYFADICSLCDLIRESDSVPRLPSPQHYSFTQAIVTIFILSHMIVIWYVIYRTRLLFPALFQMLKLTQIIIYIKGMNISVIYFDIWMWWVYLNNWAWTYILKVV